MNIFIDWFDGNGKSINPSTTQVGSVPINKGEQRITKTVTVPANAFCGSVVFSHLGTTANASKEGFNVNWFRDVMFVEGEVSPTAFIPNNNEGADGIIKFNANGISVHHSNLNNEWTRMTANGFERHSNSGALMGTYHYLTITGTMTGVDAGQTRRVQVPTEMKGKNWTCTYWAGNILPAYNSDLLNSYAMEKVGEDRNAGWIDFKANLWFVGIDDRDRSSRGKMNFMWEFTC